MVTLMVLGAGFWDTVSLVLRLFAVSGLLEAGVAAMGGVVMGGRATGMTGFVVHRGAYRPP